MGVRVIAFIAFYSCHCLLFAESHMMIWVGFTDKKNTPFSICRPEEFLTPRSIERRLRQNISVDYYDLPVTPDYIARLNKISGIDIYYTSRWLNGAILSITDTTLKDQIKSLNFVRNLEVVKPNSNLKNTGLSVGESHHGTVSEINNTFYSPYDLKWNENISGATSVYWNFYPPYGQAQNQIEKLNGQVLHTKGYWGHGKVIALLDAGFLNVNSVEAFYQLLNNGKILGSKDFVDPGGNVFITHPHGTSVLSVIGGLLDGEFAGTALGSSFWLLRTEDARSEFRIEEFNWLAGAEFADSVGADIINSSLGYTEFDDASQNYTIYDLDGKTTVVAIAANKASSRGILVISSAGNYGTQSWQYIGSPADAPGVIAVGGTDSLGTRVSFSSVGYTSDGRIKPDLMAQASSVAVINSQGNFARANGTSFAAPLISGLTACLWQAFPDATNIEIKDALRGSSNRFLSPDSLYGFGIPDFQKAYDILRVGHGREHKTRVTLANNPIDANSSLKLYSEGEDIVTIEVINNYGQSIFHTGNIFVAKGYNELKPFGQIGSLPSGVYFIRLTFSSHYQVIKAVKL